MAPEGQKAKPGIRARKLARRFAVQGLYQWKMTGASSKDIEEQFRQDQDLSKVDGEHLHDLLSSVPRDEAQLLDLVTPILDRPSEELDPIEYSILLMGAHELRSRPDVPYKVVINEAIELAKLFGAAESHKYVNSVLDKLARQLRKLEILS